MLSERVSKWCVISATEYCVLSGNVVSSESVRERCVLSGSIKECCVLSGRIWGAGIAQWLERRTRDCKVAGSNPCWNGGRIFFFRVDFLC